MVPFNSNSNKAHRAGSKTLKILFFSEAVTLAHVVRPWLLATGLLDSGIIDCEIYFAASPAFDVILNHSSSKMIRFVSEGRFIRCSLSSRTPAQFSEILERGGILFDEQRLSDYVDEELKLIRSIKPDLIIGDLRPSLSVSATLASVPYWNITNGYWSKWATPLPPPLPAIAALRRLTIPLLIKRALLSSAGFVYPLILSKIFAAQARGLNAVRVRYGLTPFKDYLTGFGYGDKVLLADSPGIVPMPVLPPNHHYLGALSWSPDVKLPAWWSNLPQDKPVVYVSLGSSGILDSLPDVLAALRPLNVAVILTTAGRDIPKALKHSNVFIADFLPGDAACRRASLVISNGGSPTSYQALREGKPVLGIASNMDQLLAMSRVQAAGAGILLRSDVLSCADIQSAATKLLKVAKYKDAAQRLANDLKNYDAITIVTQLLRDNFQQANSFSTSQAV